MAFGIDINTLATELDAVNEVLRVTSIAPVDSLDDTQLGDLDVAQAAILLNHYDKAIQGRGWSFNEESAFTLSPDAITNEINLPAGTLRVHNAYWGTSGLTAAVTQRGQRLYNLETQTFLFTQDVQVDIIIRLPFTDIPEQCRRLIWAKAALDFQAPKQGSPIVLRVNSDMVTKAEADMGEYEDTVKPLNNIYGNIGVVSRLFGSYNGGVRRRNT